jgi:hypothetical protein
MEDTTPIKRAPICEEERLEVAEFRSLVGVWDFAIPAPAQKSFDGEGEALEHVLTVE